MVILKRKEKIDLNIKIHIICGEWSNAVDNTILQLGILEGACLSSIGSLLNEQRPQPPADDISCKT